MAKIGIILGVLGVLIFFLSINLPISYQIDKNFTDSVISNNSSNEPILLPSLFNKNPESPPNFSVKPANVTVQPPPTEFYGVYVHNSLNVPIDEIVLFYNDNSGQLNMLIERNINPGVGRGFALGACTNMLSYAYDVYAGGDVERFPPPPHTVMTPALSSQLNPGDPGPCIDAWEVL